MKTELATDGKHQTSNNKHQKRHETKLLDS